MDNELDFQDDDDDNTHRHIVPNYIQLMNVHRNGIVKWEQIMNNL